jgi:tRNA1(Val) A37 N6-methylase TrmN6
MNLDLGAHKARGAFFTPPEISRFLVSWAIRSADDAVLEPSCGDAAFLLPAAERLRDLGASQSHIAGSLRGVEIHQPSADYARDLLLASDFDPAIVVGDFFDEEATPAFDAVVGNPPYVRYQDFSGAARAKSLRAALAHGVRLTSLASSWAAFTVHAAQFLKDDGRLALVLPAELLSVNYAASVRRFLLSRFAKVRLVVFEKLVFPGVLEDVVLLLAEGRGSASHFEVHQARDASDLANVSIGSWRGFSPRENEKWTPALLCSDALELYREVTGRPEFTRMGVWGDTSLGAVTGDNKFFALTAADVARLGLAKTELLRISPPGARHLRGLEFTSAAWRERAAEGDPCYLFYPPTKELSAAAAAYISDGEARGVHTAYKCKVRAPWWRVPVVGTPDLLFAYMNHDRPRLISNEAGVTILNSLYGITLKPSAKRVGRACLPLACLNTATLLGSEIVGRSYGGGLLKHEPKEVDQLPVPSVALLSTVERDLEFIKPQLGIALRRGNLLRAVSLVDEIILERHLNLDSIQVTQLRHAREGLFQRRVSRGRSSRGED